MYQNVGVAQSDTEAVKCITFSGARNFGQVNLGWMYKMVAVLGRAAPKQLSGIKSVEQKIQMDKIDLLDVPNGRGGASDTKAVKWYRKSLSRVVLWHKVTLVGCTKMVA